MNFLYQKYSEGCRVSSAEHKHGHGAWFQHRGKEKMPSNSSYVRMHAVPSNSKFVRQNARGSKFFPKPCLGDLTTLSPGDKQVFPNVNVQAEDDLMCWGGSLICIPENTLLLT